MTETEPQSLEQLAEGLLSPEATEEAPAQERTEAEETPEPEAVEAEADGEDEAEEVEASEVDEEETEDDQEAEEQPDTFTVKVDGKEVQVSLDELTRGYAGQSYIQKGMAENAEARKALEQQYHAVSQQGQQLAALVQSLQTDGLTPPTAPDVSRLETDPIGYFQDKEAYDRAKADHDQRLAAIQHQQAQLQQLQAQAQRQHRAEQMQILHAAIPDFAHPEKGAALQRKLVDIGTGYGFAQEEIAGITDARMVQVLHDAMQFRDLMGKKAEVDKKAAKARPVTKPSAKKAQNPAKQKREQQRQRLRQSGDIKDAVDLILE